jgi:hypothetical protein
VFDFRNLLHRDGTVYNTVTPEELTKQPEVRVCVRVLIYTHTGTV